MKKPNNIKLTKNTTKIDKLEETRVSPWFDDYRDMFSLRVKPVTEAFISRLADELIQWSLKEDSIVLGDFCDERGIQPKSLSRWMEKRPDLADAYDFARRKVVSRREKGALTRKFDPSFVFNTMPMLDPAYREFAEWKAKLRSLEEKKEKVVIEINDLSKRVEIHTNEEK